MNSFKSVQVKADLCTGCCDVRSQINISSGKVLATGRPTAEFPSVGAIETHLGKNPLSGGRCEWKNPRLDHDSQHQSPPKTGAVLVQSNASTCNGKAVKAL